MRYTITTTLLFAALAQSGLALADKHGSGMDHSTMQMQGEAMQMQTHMAHGTVNSIDMPHGKFNVTHGPIESLGWPAMTMDFTAKDPAMLKHLKLGQKVKFGIVKEAPKKFVVTEVTPAK
ncbi:MAG: copper-binding protein [Gammaproteobacteria bacterium]|nr:copper-binding protein [Gammaproteobacteria bacterium]MBU1482007.1 copper-binding protein [Gammaproteobacteria bacterium]